MEVAEKCALFQMTLLQALQHAMQVLVGLTGIELLGCPCQKPVGKV